MDMKLLEEIASRYAGGLPREITKQLTDVEILVCETVAHAQKELNEILDEDEKVDDDELPANCKGVFIGEQLETDESDEHEDGDQSVYVNLPEGFIVVIAANIESAEEAGLVLLHETGHALGMDEDEVKALGLGLSQGAVAPTLKAVPENAKPNDV